MRKLTFMIFTIISTMSYGQEIKNQGAWYFIGGYQFINTTNFNAASGNSGWSSLSPNFAMGYGGYGEGKKWIVGGEGVYMNHSISRSANSKTAESFGGLGCFFAGYKILKNDKWKVFPAIGIGWGGIKAVLTSPSNSGSSFNSIINTEPNARAFDNGAAFLHTGIVAEYNFVQKFFIGIKTGYNVSLNGEQSWTAPGLNESLSVKDAFGGYYAQIHLGLYMR